MIGVKSCSYMWSQVLVLCLCCGFLWRGVTCSVDGIEPEVDRIGAKTTVFSIACMTGFILTEAMIL